MDNNGHGTHCAGIIAAEWNGYGVSGVSNGAKLMAIKAANGAGQISAASAIAGYDYIKTAIDCGVNVKVANNSWGGDYGGRGVSLAVKALTDKGVVVVFASGNESSDVDQYPKTSFGMRNNPRVVVVNAVDDKGEYAGFSNYGANNTDVAAPGVNIMSTLNRPRSSAFLDISESISGNDFDTPSPYFSDWSATEGTTVEIVDRGNTGKCLAVSSSLKQSNIVTFDNMDVSSFRPRYLAFDFRVDADSPYGALVGMSAADIDGRKNAAFPVQSNSGCEKWQSYIFQLDDVDYRNFSVRLAGFCFDTAAGPADPNYEETMLFDNFRFYNDIYAYGALSGTSMACPVVSGEAAILVANFPDEPADKIAARIIGSAKRVDKHKDKCISGGIANLSNALAGHIAPVLFSAKRSETTVNKNASAILIDGYFFGDTPGTVTVDGAPAEVQAWNDVQIVITKPDALSPGNHLYEVTRPSGEESFRSGHRRFAIDSVGALRSITGIADVIEDNRISDMTTLHGKVYLLMNDDFNNISLYEYNPVTNGFLECFRAPHRTCASSMVTYGGEILLITGDTRFKEMEYEVIRYEPCAAKLSYHELEASSAFAVGATLVAYGDDLLTLGGINMGTMSVSNAICRLSLTDYTVEPVGQLAMGRAGCSTFSQKGDDTGLYACFGSDLSGTINSIERIEKVGDEYVGTVIQDYTKEDVASINFGAIAFTESAEGAFVYGLRQFDEYGTVITDACSLYFSDKEPVFTVHDDLIYGKFLSNPCSVICNGHYYLAGSTDDGQVVFGEVGGFADVDRSGDVYPRASVTVGGLTLSYQSYIEYTGTAIKFPDLGVTITDGSGRSFELGSVSYKANKNAGTATFTVKTLKNVSKDIKKLFAKTPITFTILKRTLTMDNTEVKFNKKGAVTSVKYFWTYTNNKGKLLTKRFTVPKKDYYYADGSIVIKETSKNYTGDFSPSTGKEAIK